MDTSTSPRFVGFGNEPAHMYYSEVVNYLCDGFRAGRY
jgi:hypothetical protein